MEMFFRVLAVFFGIDTISASGKGKRIMNPSQYYPAKKNGHISISAMLDFGADYAFRNTSRNRLPRTKFMFAFTKGLVKKLPVKGK